MVVLGILLLIDESSNRLLDSTHRQPRTDRTGSGAERIQDGDEGCGTVVGGWLYNRGWERRRRRRHRPIDQMPTRKNSFRWLLPRAPQRRLVFKSGECNISRVNINKRGRRYLADIFTTLVDIKWRWNLLIFALAFTLSWVIFAFVWWLICFSHGDFVQHGEEEEEDEEWKPCVAEVNDFTTALLFSIETQHTIGYGYRVIEPTCPGTVAVLMVQSCFGVFIQSLVTGIVFAKLSRPKRRAHTIMFSRNAVVSKRNGQYCLLFRVGDMRKSHFVGTSIRALLVADKYVRIWHRLFTT